MKTALILLSISLCWISFLHAEVPTRKSIIELLVISGAEANLEESKEILMKKLFDDLKSEAEFKSKKDLDENTAKAFARILEDYFQKEFNYETVQEPIVLAYQKFFTQKEIDVLIEFWKSPEIKKFKSIQGELVKEYIKLTEKQVERQVNELNTILREHLDNLKQ